MAKRKSKILVKIALIAGSVVLVCAMMAAFILTRGTGENEKFEKRIKPLIEAGKPRENAIKFDELYHEFAPYDNDAIKFFDMWKVDKKSADNLFGSAGSFYGAVYGDPDNDKINSYFEIMAGELYNALVPNFRYGMIVDAENQDAPAFKDFHRMLDSFLNSQKFSPQNVIRLYGENATPFKLRDATVNISEKATENDLLLLCIYSHGNVGYLNLNWEGEYIPDLHSKYFTYEYFSQFLENVKATGVIINEACYGGSAIPYFKLGQYPRVVITQSEDNTPAFGHLLSEKFFLPTVVMDNNHDGLISVAERFDYAKNHIEGEYPGLDNKSFYLHPQISDDWNIADDLYLGE